jgi:UDP-N-acetylglucosamine--N-acetylmuramyl-(pentapeptide) pyrophosphoryl-undecaprenol N-acetylglucosamine transferase
MVADQLKEAGIDVRFSSFGEAASYVEMHGYRCAKVAPVEFAWGGDGGFSVKRSLANVPVWFTNFSRQVNQELRNMIVASPDVVVSDSRLSPIIAARILKIPSVVVLNQLKLLLAPRLRDFAISRLFENMVGELLGSMWTLAERVLVPDLPPPHTLSWHNMWGTGSASRRLEYVGFTAPKQQADTRVADKVAESLGLDRSRPLVFIHISGPSQTRASLVKVGLESAKLLQDSLQVVLSEGRPGGSTQPRKIGSGIWFYEWCPIRDEIFTMCNLAVVRGGHVALSHAIRFGKPLVTIPIENHSEQLGNSIKIAQMGMGKMLDPKGLNADKLAESVKHVLSEKKYSETALRLQAEAGKVNGIDKIAEVVMSYC